MNEMGETSDAQARGGRRAARLFDSQQPAGFILASMNVRTEAASRA
jgi:hypothetical protein